MYISFTRKPTWDLIARSALQMDDNLQLTRTPTGWGGKYWYVDHGHPVAELLDYKVKPHIAGWAFFDLTYEFPRNINMRWTDLRNRAKALKVADNQAIAARLKVTRLAPDDPHQGPVADRLRIPASATHAQVMRPPEGAPTPRTNPIYLTSKNGYTLSPEATASWAPPGLNFEAFEDMGYFYLGSPDRQTSYAVTMASNYQFPTT